MKTLQYFSSDYLEQTRHATPEQVLNFLEQYRLMQMPEPAKTKSKLISLKIQQNLLDAFRSKCELKDLKYQTQIKQLMLDWLNQT